MEGPAIADRIRATARNTDELIARLDSLNARINSAHEGDDEELAKYYEDQFAEVSLEFMDGVETIIDSWYELRGETRPAAEDEMLTPEDLDHVHEMVVGIMHSLPEAESTEAAAVISAPLDMSTVSKGPQHKVDLRG